MSDLVVIAAWVLGIGLPAYVLGRARGVHTTRLKPPPEPPFPECGCEHHLSLHDPQTGKCHERDSIYVSTKNGNRSKLVECGCRQYVGPIPPGAMILPPMLPPPVVTS